MAVNTVALVDYLSIRKEYTAGAEIQPGHLVKLNSAGQVVPHDTAGGFAEKMFALEDYPRGGVITEAYQAGQKVQCWIATPGDVVYAILGTGQSVVVGNLLASKGDGTLKKFDALTDKYPIGVALEAITTDATTTARIRVRIM